MRTPARTWYPRLFIVTTLAAFSGLMVLFLWPNTTEQSRATQASGAGRKAPKQEAKVVLDVRSGDSSENARPDAWSDAFAAKLAAKLRDQGILVVSEPAGAHKVEVLLVKTVSEGALSLSIEPRVLRPGQQREARFGAGTIEFEGTFSQRVENIPDGTPEGDIRAILVPALAESFASALAQRL